MGMRLGLDTGGTFTDLIGLHEDGRPAINKVPSTPQRPLEAVAAAIGGLETGGAVVESLLIGTTVATNALLQRRGATVLFLTTAGFEDVPFIGRMNRRHHYSLAWTKPAPLVERRHCIGVAERVGHHGEVVAALDEAALEAVADAVAERLASIAPAEAAIAVCLLFSYLNPEHELRLGSYLQARFPEVPISLSHQVAPIWREFERGSTVIADAYIKPLIRSYVRGVARGLQEAGLQCPWALVKSNGGSTTAAMAEAQPIGLLLSGLSGGLICGAHFARLAGASDALTLDMGGTSCDVGVIRDGGISYTTDFQIEWGLPVCAPTVDISTIGAGGGSVAWIDKGGLLRVGPRSAGADPGPVCYGRGGTGVTVTDANLVLGRLNPAYFLGGKLPLHVEPARERLRSLGDALGLDEMRAAQAVLAIANENMANALRVLSIDRGLDPRGFALVAFGGAGPLHAADIARGMGMARAIIPIFPGLCSALGTLLADLQVNRVLSTSFRSDRLDAAAVAERFDALVASATEELGQEGYGGRPRVERSISMRYWGQNYEHDVVLPDGPIDAAMLAQAQAAFSRLHERFYGYSISDEVIELILFNVTVTGPQPKPALTADPPAEGPVRAVERRPVHFPACGFVDTPIYRRETLPARTNLPGPAIVEEVDSTILVHPGQRLEVEPSGIMSIYLGQEGN